MQIRELTRATYESLLWEHTDHPPIEQTPLWADYQATIDGRTPWGYLAIERDDGEVRAILSLIDFRTHGYHYLRSVHGPVWFVERSIEEEELALRELRDYVAKRDRKVVFIRLAVSEPLKVTRPVLSSCPYDATVVIDLTGGEDQIFARMKPRGRRDVRKSVRESPATCADETEQAGISFAEYYAVMEATAERDEFAAAPQSDYEQMIRALGPEHCRVFASRIDGKVVCWGLATIMGTQAVYYYAASGAEAQRSRCVDKQMLFVFNSLAELGCTTLDLMGIGSDFSPTLMGLNEFKTKFTKQITPVAPDRDVPVIDIAYNALVRVRDLRDERAERARRRAEERTPDQPRDDLLPVVLGGDLGAYALGREFHEAYGVTSVCIAPLPIKAIELSTIFAMRYEDPTAQSVSRIVGELAAQNPTKKIVVVANTDAYVKVLEECLPTFPDNVYCPLPSREVVERVTNKATFAELCAKYGLETPRTEVVDLAGDDAIAPTTIDFPVVAKPADSASYFPMHYKGFRKAYAITSQAELDQLWADLREGGYEGTFLVQEMIEGDDTSMDCITVYVNQEGKPTMFACMQVLLQDHAPTMIGNYVALLTRPCPELWEKVGQMLSDEGYRGFANFDIKHDARTGRTVFLDCNPRVGRASFSVCAAGVNPMRVLVSDVVDGRGNRVLKATDPALYLLVPRPLIYRYLRDEALRDEVTDLIKQGRAVDPLEYWAETDPRRAFFVAATKANYLRKFMADYPAPSDVSF